MPCCLVEMENSLSAKYFWQKNQLNRDKYLCRLLFKFICVPGFVKWNINSGLARLLFLHKTLVKCIYGFTRQVIRTSLINLCLTLFIYDLHHRHHTPCCLYSFFTLNEMDVLHSNTEFHPSKEDRLETKEGSASNGTKTSKGKLSLCHSLIFCAPVI